MHTSKIPSLSFLLEIIVVIFMFIIGATICLSVYMKSIYLNTLANAKKEALLYAEQRIETKQTKPGTYLLDQSFHPSDEGYYMVRIRKEKEAYSIMVSKDADILVKLPFYGE